MYPSITKKVGVGVISTKLWLLLLDFLNKNALTLRPYLFSVKSLKSVLNYMLRIGNVVRSQKLCAENHEKKLFIYLDYHNSKAVRIDQYFLFFLTFSKKEIIFVSFVIGKQYLHSTVFLCTIINDPHRTATVMGEHNILAYS